MSARRRLVSAEINYASFWKRVGARLLDQLVLIVPGALLLLAVDLAFQDSLRYALRNNPMEVIAIDVTKRLWKLGLATLMTWLYFALFESSIYQGTPGKKAMGLMVTDNNGSRLTFGRASGRYFAKLISGLTLGVGFLMALFTEKRQMLHDIIASCLVLDKKPGCRKPDASRRNCPSCGMVNNEAARFCAGCGNSLVLKCSACGQEIAFFSVHCTFCGAHVASAETKKPAAVLQGSDERKRTAFLLLIGICGAAVLCIMAALLWGGIHKYRANKEQEYFFEKAKEYAMLPDSGARTQWSGAIVAPQIERWQRAAEAGNSFANYVVGRTYYWGAGLDQSYSKALKYFRVAADLGNDNAQNHIGAMYQQGQGVAKNDYEALEWFKKSAQQGNGVALLNLGRSYEEGTGVWRDVNEAIRYYREAASRGDQDAKDSLKRLGQ